MCVKTLNFRYLPPGDERKRWAYNDQIERTLKANRSKWKTIVPNNGDETDFNNKIVTFCVEVSETFPNFSKKKFSQKINFC